MSAPAAEAMLATELWVSFGSLIRSYAAAASLNLHAPANVVWDGNRLTATAGSATLEFQYNPGSGTGNWVLRGGGEEMCGRFELLPDGRIAMDGKTIDLDHAAIDFAAALMQAAKPAGTTGL